MIGQALLFDGLLGEAVTYCEEGLIVSVLALLKE